MRNLDIATLRSLQAVAEYGAVTRAAESLNMTQSALSMQMKRLEEIFGQPMLVKQGRGVVLSDMASELLVDARKLVAMNDRIMARFTGERPEGRLRVGLTTDWLLDKVAQAVRAFRQHNPRVELIINDGATVDLRKQMKNGDHDVILTTEFDAPPGALHLAKLDLIWVGAIAGTAWRQRPLPVANSPRCAYYPVGIAALDQAGIEWRQSVGDGGCEAWRMLAAADLGVNLQVAGIALAGLEAIDHGGALPPLPPTWLNAYVTDGPASCLASDFACYLRRAVNEVAEVAAAAA